MENFARILEMPFGQVLLTKDTNEEGDYLVNVRFDVEGVTVTAGLGYGEKEKADHCFDTFAPHNAQDMYDGFTKEFL